MFSFLFKKKKQEDEFLKPQRFNDAVMIVTQNNSSKTLKIEAVSMNALNLLGYQQNDIIDRDIRDFLTNYVNDEINDSLEFEEGGPDLSEVLGKTARLQVKKQDKEVLPLRLRIVRSLSTKNMPRFQLVLNDDTLRSKIEENREKYRTNLRGDEIFDSVTGLLSKESIMKDLELIAFHADKRDILSHGALIEVGNIEELRNSHGEIARDAAMREIAANLNQTKRDGDILGIVDDNKILMLLTETPEDNINIPLSRLKRKLESNPIELELADEKLNYSPSIQVRRRRIRSGFTPDETLVEISRAEPIKD